ncbi:MAG: endonuclease/exonuclease/phosphatase family protein [Bdellovibrionales bacterium]
MKTIILIFISLRQFGIALCRFRCSNCTLRIVHYNIKELNSFKILNQAKQQGSQLNAVMGIVSSLRPDLLSLNEIQYDLPNVPDAGFQSSGENLNILAPLFGMAGATSVFYPANTGMKSCPRPEELTDELKEAFQQRRYDCPAVTNGAYILENPSAEDRILFSDPVNFGMFPGQYSTGLLSRYPIKKQIIISEVRWKDVNPDLDLSQFTDGNGNPLPEDMELFDKNFNHVVMDFQGAPLNVILLHTVPAFGFGNERTPNFQRNLDQLRFLQWYLGSASTGIGPLEGIEPLAEGASFVAMGDWNVDRDSDNLGAAAIADLQSEFKMWKSDRQITYLGSSFAPQGFTAQLDYMLLSHDLQVREGFVYSPAEEREEMGCGRRRQPYPERPGKTLVHYRNSQGVSCAAFVSDAYYQLKTASDHLPLFAEISR